MEEGDRPRVQWGDGRHGLQNSGKEAFVSDFVAGGGRSGFVVEKEVEICKRSVNGGDVKEEPERGVRRGTCTGGLNPKHRRIPRDAKDLESSSFFLPLSAKEPLSTVETGLNSVLTAFRILRSFFPF